MLSVTPFVDAITLIHPADFLQTTNKLKLTKPTKINLKNKCFLKNSVIT